MAKQNHKKAFTLVEALVAISILMIAIASPMTLAQKGLSTATLSKDQMIASFLAQDAIEAVKNIRDQTALRGGNDWLATLSDCVCTDDTTCNFDLSQTPQTLKFCNIDTTREWTSDAGGSIQAGIVNDSKLKISYTTINNIKHFLKYDYTGSNCDNSNNSYVCNSKFTRYINIRKTSNPDEAVVSVRVFWDSPQGVQKIDVQNFIYNYSGNIY